jgi:hypothetical protein
MKNEPVEDLLKQLKELRVKESNVIAKIEAATRQADQDSTETYRKVDQYNVGDKVVVGNRVTKPLRAAPDWTAFKECRGRVTDVKGDRVFYITDNGTKTWRNKRNLSLVVKHE